MPHSKNSIVPDSVVVIVCGTLVAQWYADLVYRPLADVARSQGYEVRVMAIPKLGLGSMDEALEEMALSLLAEYPDPETKFVLIGHSQGGSHIVGLLRRLGGRVLPPVISIAAPHHGTHLTNLGPSLRFLPESFREMATHSEVLRRLRQVEEVVGAVETAAEVEVVNLMSCLDQLVLPFSASVLSGAENIVLAPRPLHPLLKQFGFRRSKGVELVSGYAGHLGVIKHPATLAAINSRLARLERSQP